MHRSVGFEFGDQTFGNLDLPSRDVDAQTAAAVVDALLGDAGVMALRADGGGVATIAMSALPRVPDSAAKRPLDAATLENVVITGGSGAIGLRYAQHCIEHGARTVILLSRNGIDPAMLAQLAGQHDVEVHAPHCDITDRTAVSAVAADYAGSGASLLIHTAGIATASSACRTHRRGRGGGVRRESSGAGGDGRRLAAAAGMPNLGLLVGVRGLGWSRPCRVRGVQPDARCVGRPTACQGAGLHGDSMGTVAGRRSRRRPLRSPAPSAPV